MIKGVLCYLVVVCVLIGPMAVPAKGDIDVTSLYRGALPPSNSELALQCGPNCLHLLLQASGVSCTLREVRSKFDVVPGKGVSLDQLQKVAQEYGLNARVVECNPEQLVTAAPAIALLAVTSEPGHFVVVAGKDGKRVHLIDGTTGILSSSTMGNLSRRYSGYALTVPNQYATRQSMIPALAIVAIVCLIVLAAFAVFANRSGELSASSKS